MSSSIAIRLLYFATECEEKEMGEGESKAFAKMFLQLLIRLSRGISFATISWVDRNER